MGEDGGAIALDMLVEPDAGAGFGYDACECRLADLKRIAPQVVAIQLDQVESVQKDAVVSAVVPEGSLSVFVGRHGAMNPAPGGCAYAT
jgi:hypothetical protein